MNNLNDIIIYLGSNMKDFIVSVFIKFILYMTILVILLGSFFGSIDRINIKLFSVLAVIFLAIANLFINRRIVLKRTLRLLKEFPENMSKDDTDIVNFETGDWRPLRKEISKWLRSSIKGYKTMEFIDGFTMFRLLSGGIPDIGNSSIRELYRDHIKQKVAEAGISIITALPFISISLIFTAGYKFELRMISLILAVIFYLFIRSAIITPVFFMITLNKISEKLMAESSNNS